MIEIMVCLSWLISDPSFMIGNCGFWWLTRGPSQPRPCTWRAARSSVGCRRLWIAEMVGSGQLGLVPSGKPWFLQPYEVGGSFSIGTKLNLLRWAMNESADRWRCRNATPTSNNWIYMLGCSPTNLLVWYWVPILQGRRHGEYHLGNMFLVTKEKLNAHGRKPSSS